MYSSEVNNMLKIIEQYNLGNLEIENKLVEERLNLICNFISSIPTYYLEGLEILDSTPVRFCDYYDSEKLHGKEIISYFNDNYPYDDKDKIIDAFALYVIIKNAKEIVYNYEICDNPMELYELLDCNSFFDDILEVISYCKERQVVSTLENEKSFINLDSKYKILFTGLSNDDIEYLEKFVKKAFIKKLNGQLSDSDYITLSESIDHVKDLYNFPISRIQFADDYRIAYLRKDNVTAILGVSLKTGKPIDYTRYDSVARNEVQIYKEIEYQI